MKKLSAVIEAHCVDLEHAAEELKEHGLGCFDNTISELRKATTELRNELARYKADMEKQEPYGYILEKPDSKESFWWKVAFDALPSEEEKKHLQSMFTRSMYSHPFMMKRLSPSEIDELRDATVERTATFIPYQVFEICAEAVMDKYGIPKEGGNNEC